MFDRIISIDWSGAGRDTSGVDLRVAAFDAANGPEACIVDRRYGERSVASWSRHALQQWLVGQLRHEQPVLVAMDFGFGLPWGSDRAVFGVSGWRPMVRAIGERYAQCGTARSTATAINGLPRFQGHGPYRFDDTRSDFRFYADNDVAYFRLTELIAPQAISQWYLGSGGTVGFHTISGLAAIDQLIQLRERGEIDFTVWPHECLAPTGTRHVLAESYPAICERLVEYGACRTDDPHQRDAWRVIQMLLSHREHGRLPDLFQIKERPFGRISDVDFKTQIQFEGHIIGIG